MTPRTPTGFSVTSPNFEYTDAPKYDDIHTSKYVCVWFIVDDVMMM